MKLTFLGTSAGAPTLSRNVSGLALQLPQSSTTWLFDCGEGTQHPILRTPISPSKLDRVFITHLHGDHLFGLLGLLATRSAQVEAQAGITLAGPHGLAEFVRCGLQVSRTQLGYPVAFETVRAGWRAEAEDVSVECAPLDHRVETYGYAVVEKDKTGHFDVDRARALGIPPGPLYGRLKNGEAVTLPDGRVIDGTELIGPPIPGRKVVVCGDTAYTRRAVELARDADVLVHEATYSREDEALALRSQHATAAMAARIAWEAGVKLLIL